MKLHDFAPLYENYWLSMENSIFQCPCTQYVRLIVGNWWTILLWSGSTKGWSRAGSAILLICTEVFLGLHIKTLIILKCFAATFGIRGAIAPTAPPINAPALNVIKMFWMQARNRPETFWQTLAQTRTEPGLTRKAWPDLQLWFCSGDVNSKKQKMVRLWFTKNKRTLYFLLRFNFTHWILHLLQPLQSWAVKSQRRFFGCIKVKGDFMQVSQSM